MTRSAVDPIDQYRRAAGYVDRILKGEKPADLHRGKPTRTGGHRWVPNAPSLGVELTPVGVHDAGEIERAITTFARGSNGGLILVGPTSSVERYRDLINRADGAAPVARDLPWWSLVRRSIGDQAATG
jgi:hypothetical protein